MVALKGGEIDAFVARPGTGRSIVLVFGPDSGLVRERADAIIRASVDDPKDPFSLARLEAEDLADNPQRIVEEANTIPLFGGRRAVWVRPGGRNIAAAIETLVASPPPDCRIVIEAGDLKRNAPLRALCEKSRAAVAIPCYADGERDLVRLIDEELRGAGLAIAPDARAALLPLLGGDRQASRNELGKLVLYARGKERVELADVLAVVADASTLVLDSIVDAALAGRTAELESELGKAVTAGTSAGTVIFALARQIGILHRARLAVEDGTSVGQQLDSMFVHFSRKAAVEAALKAWTAARLARAMQQVAEAQLESRRQPALADAIMQRALLSLAVTARRRE
jgi:DNA polymerase-3 subunit delta